ncbi:hypothetical protein HDV63DRAFT_385996 [Trichoderma sp. SZMC 28014]
MHNGHAASCSLAACHRHTLCIVYSVKSQDGVSLHWHFACLCCFAFFGSLRLAGWLQRANSEKISCQQMKPSRACVSVT